MTKRSSTFSFDHVPAMRGTAARVITVTMVLLAAMELGARALGYTASVTDDEDLLCLQLERVEEPGSVVLVGASRIRAGFSADVFRERYPGRPLVNLALAGKCPLAMLAELADNDEFHGSVIYAINESCIDPRLRSHQRGNINYCEQQWSTSKSISRRLRLALEPYLALMRPTVGLANVIQSLKEHGTLPEHDYYQMNADRLNDIDFSEKGPELSKVRVARLRAHHRRNKPLPVATWLREARLMDSYAQRIQQRGGRVWVVRFPTSGTFWQLEERAYPRSQYWDKFAAEASAHLVHFADLPTADLACGDQSHLDGRDAPAFTAALLDEIEKKDGFAD